MDYDFASSAVIVVAVVAAIFIFRWIVKAVMTGGNQDSSSAAYEAKRCACGWEGNVSKFVNKCPSCGSPV